MQGSASKRARPGLRSAPADLRDRSGQQECGRSRDAADDHGLHSANQRARAAEADDFIRAMPQGYDTPIGERGVTLSGGQRQRLALARAFLKNSPILILDEPTAALDSETEAAVLRSLERLRQGRTLFVVAHRLSTVRQADLLLVMEDGQIVERGRHDELAARGGHYARVCELQFGAQTR